MTIMPPSPFFDPGATDCPPAEATASSRQSYDAVVDIPARFLIDEESFLYAIDPPPLPAASPMPAFLAAEIEPLLKTLFHRAGGRECATT